MKIALCLEYPIGQSGGTEMIVKELLRSLAGKHELVLVSADTEETLDQSGWKSSLAGHIPYDPEQAGPEKARQLAAAVAEHGVQLAHFHFGGNFGWSNRFPGHCPIPYLNRLGVSCLSTVHSVGTILDGYCGRQRALAVKLALFPLAWAGKLQQLWHVRREIAVSQHDLKKMQCWYWPLRRRYLQIYHSRLHHEANAKVTDEPRENLILNVGHLAWRKGQVFLTEAFAQIAARYPTWKLMLAGHRGDDSENRIRDIARAQGLEQRILLAGRRDDALALMRHAAIYVQPSNFEALGLALQEAMYCGAACIGTRVGGIPELLAGKDTGLLVEPRNVDQLAAALEQLIADPALRQRLGKVASTSITARGMTAEAMLEKHLRLYESFARQR
jgi:glycosyltransferase involved in cell wall biosynthesis